MGAMHRTAALTGATGFVGRHILDALLEAGWAVRALVRPERTLLPHPRLTPVVGDLSHAASLAGLLEGADVVVHCAGLTKARAGADYFAVNAAGTERLASTALEHPGIRGFLLISSLAAREPNLSPYAASKRQAETELARVQARFPTIILRPPAIYGPGDRDIFQFFKQFQAGFAVVPNVRGARFSLLYVADLAEAVVRLAEVGEQPDGVMEIHDGHEGGYAWPEVAAAAETVFGRGIRPYGVSRPVMLGLARAMGLWSGLTGTEPVLSVDKVRELFHPDWVCWSNPTAELTDWRPRTGLVEGLRLTADWYRQEGWL